MSKHLRINQTEQKLRGGYYTPQNVANYVAEWVVSQNKPCLELLEPSCGDGVFIKALSKVTDGAFHISAHELFSSEAQKVAKICADLNLEHKVRCGDFLEWANSQIADGKMLFDGIIGNPPFIRYQYIEDHFQDTAEQCFKLLGQKFSKLTNAWIVFVFASVALLKAGGRLGMVIPTEIISIIQAKPLRDFLVKSCNMMFIISPKEIIFKDTLQGVVLLMVEKKSNPDVHDALIAHKQVDFESLTSEPIAELIKGQKFIPAESLGDKWSLLYLESHEIDLLLKIKKLDSFVQMSQFSKASVCLTTGANDFFVASQDTINNYELHEFVSPIFMNSGDADGIICSEDLYQKNIAAGNKTCLININTHFDNLNEKQKSYVQLGEAKKYHERYKCRIREPWHMLSLAPRGDVLIGKFAYDYPKLWLNQIRAYTVDNFYHIKLTTDQFTPEQLITAFYNPYTMIMTELAGRFHGGGLLELTPSEVGNICVPKLFSNEINISQMNSEIQKSGFESFIEVNGKKILSFAGLSNDEITELQSIWKKLVKTRKRK